MLSALNTVDWPEGEHVADVVAELVGGGQRHGRTRIEVGSDRHPRARDPQVLESLAAAVAAGRRGSLVLHSAEGETRAWAFAGGTTVALSASQLGEHLDPGGPLVAVDASRT